MTTLIDQDYQVLLTKLSPHNVSTLQKIFEDQGWPSKKIFVSSLSASAISAQGFYFSAHKKHMEQEDLYWTKSLSLYSLSLASSPDSFIPWLVNEKHNNAFEVLVKNSTEEEAKIWSQSKSPMIAFDSSHDKATWLSAMVLSNNLQSLKFLLEKFPSLLHSKDKKNRSLLFFARSQEMVDYLIEQKISIDVKNNKGQTAMDSWLENKVPNAQEWIGSITNQSGDIQEAVLFKILVFDRNFTNEEEGVYQKMLDDQWSYTGRVGGIERKWTSAEVWKFAELLMAYRLTVSPNFRSGYYDYNEPLLHRSQFVFELIQENRKKFADLSEKIFSSREVSPFEKAVESMIALRKNPKDSEFITIGSPDHSINIREVILSQKITMEHIFSCLKDSEKEAFNEVMNMFANHKIAETNVGQSRFLHVYIPALAVPSSKGGMLTKNVAEAAASSRQNEGLRSGAFAQKWITSANDFLVTNPDKTEINQYGDFVRMGLSLCGMPMFSENSKLKKEFQEKLVTLISMGAPMEKVPVRWTKHYTPELKISVSRWIMEKTIEDRLAKKKQKEPEVPVKKRRM